MAKIISIKKTIERTELPLTPLMIKTLKLACKLQSTNQLFGQVDLKGSFIALVKREYIDYRNILAIGQMELAWFVTDSGIQALEKAGFKGKC